MSLDDSNQGTAGVTVDELRSLHSIMEGTADVTGRAFIRELVRHLALVLNVPCVLVSVFASNRTRLRAVACWENGRFIEPGDYDLAHSPCSRVVGGDVYHCESGIQREFPLDEHLRALGAESYRGVPLRSSDNQSFGHLAITSLDPMPRDAPFLKVLQLFAQRAAAELERVSTLTLESAAGTPLHAVIQSTLDPIIGIDSDRKIRLFNRAAERVLRVSAEEVIGRPVGKYLTDALMQELQVCLMETPNSSGARQYRWLSGSLMAIRHDGEHFPMEGTASTLRIEDSVHCTLILRDLTERSALEHNLPMGAAPDSTKRPIDQPPGMKIIGKSEVIRNLLSVAKSVADSTASVLIHGETGTGKELVARAIHAWSARNEKSFIDLNCAALPAQLIESELFGHERGSFTGATERRIGRFERADGGTLFLDEIGDLPLELQPKLLRVLQDKKMERVGGTKPIEVDARLIAATNRNLPEMVRQGTFREDLFFRLSVFPIFVPPLRNRSDDIPLLANEMVSNFSTGVGRHAGVISPAGMERLLSHSWPGNVRELENVIQRAVVISLGSELDIDAAMDASVFGFASTTSNEERSDVGNNTYSFGRYFETNIQSVLMSGYLGSIGFGYPAAMGAWAAVGDTRQIVAVTGDGGFGQYMGEVLTAVKYNMNITHILLNNHELGKISKEQRVGEWEVWQTSLHNPNFADYANNCGALGIRVADRASLRPALERALGYDGPATVEVMTDPSLF